MERSTTWTDFLLLFCFFFSPCCDLIIIIITTHRAVLYHNRIVSCAVIAAKSEKRKIARQHEAGKKCIFQKSAQTGVNVLNRWIEKKKQNSNNERRQQFYGLIAERQSRYRADMCTTANDSIANSEVNFFFNALARVWVWACGSGWITICLCMKSRFHLNFIHIILWFSFRFLHVLMRFKILSLCDAVCIYTLNYAMHQ